MKLVITAAAEADLEQIADYIAQDSPRRALTFIQELRTACHPLTAAPLAHPPVGRQVAADLRRRRHGRYLIFYRVRNDVITIIRVIHGARDYDVLLGLDEE